MLLDAKTLYGNTDEGLDSVIIAALSHEWIGHFPAILSIEQKGPKTTDEIRAYDRSAQFLQWWIDQIQSQPEQDRIGNVKQLQQALEREKFGLNSWMNAR